MLGSQASMETYLGRFINAVDLLQHNSDYMPTRADIQKSVLLDYVTALKNSNNEVNLKEAILSDLRSKRLNLSFKSVSSVPDKTIEAIIANILSYVGAENGVDNSVYKAIKVYKQKIHPKTKSKKADGTSGPSRSERTYTALSGYLSQTIHLLTNTPGLIYQPNNASISISNLMTVNNTFAQLNLDIATAEQNLKTARITRQNLFNGADGVKQKVKVISMYLASFEGGKKSTIYQQFAALFK